MTASSSRTTRRPGSEVSATSAKHSRLKSSTKPGTKPTAIDKGARHEVQAPALVRSLRDRHRHPRAERPLASRASAHLQPFLTMEAAELPVVHDQIIPAHQRVETAIAEPATNGRQLAQARPTDRIARWPTAGSGLPLKVHPAATRVSADVTPLGAV